MARIQLWQNVPRRWSRKQKMKIKKIIISRQVSDQASYRASEQQTIDWATGPGQCET